MVFVDAQFHARVMQAHLAQRARREGVRGRRTGEGHRQRAAVARRAFAQALLQRIEVSQQALGIGVQRLAGLGQPHALGVALEQGQADFSLQAADLLRQRRLLHAQRFGGTRQVAGAGHGGEVAQLPEVHTRTIWKNQ